MGTDHLPVLADWKWSVSAGGTDDTANWSVTGGGGYITRIIGWANQTFEISGEYSTPVAVNITPSVDDGLRAPGFGFVINAPQYPGGIPTADSDYSALPAQLHPVVARFGSDIARVSYTWDASRSAPKYNFTIFDQLVNFSRSMDATVLFSLPAGTWGDGNLLPGGMPLNLSLPIPSPSGIGYMPADSAWTTYVGGIAAHVRHANLSLGFWSVGNEFPLTNSTLAAGYTHLFNLAAAAIHAQLPNASVGSDVMTNRTYFGYFASHAHRVGFLSFHYYPSIGICVANGTYCPPNGAGGGTATSTLLARPAYSMNPSNLPPFLAQSLWANLTGRWIPIFNSETNLGASGGSPATKSIGTDPRQQTLVGAAWLGSLLVDSARGNVSLVTYFTLTGPSLPQSSITWRYGGWGFGLTSEGTSDNDTAFAPYWAAWLWGQGFSPEAPGVSTQVNLPGVVSAFSARSSQGVSTWIASTVNVPVTVDLSVIGGGYGCSSVRVLDQGSYQQSFDVRSNTSVLLGSAVRTASLPDGHNLTIQGYGVALIQWSRSASNATVSGGCAGALGQPSSLGELWSNPLFWGGVAGLTAGSAAAVLLLIRRPPAWHRRVIRR